MVPMVNTVAEAQAIVRALRFPPTGQRSYGGRRVIDVAGGPRTHGAEAKLVCFAAGMRFPKHRHVGHEAVLLLDGSYTESTGRVYSAGDLHEMATGTEHSFVIAKNEPCVAASLQAGLEFTGVVMRLLAKLVGGK